MRVIAPIYPLEGRRYVEPMKGEYDMKELNNIYDISSKMEYYVNTTENGMLGWKSANYFMSDLGEVLEN